MALGLCSAISRYVFLAGWLLVLQPSTFAQQAALDPVPQPEKSAKSTLDEILVRMEINFLKYHKSIPSFFCDEHVVSGMRQDGMRLHVTRTDSTFRLKRFGDGDKARLLESREIRTINSKPVKGVEALNGPAIFIGAFSIASAIVAFDEKACFTYHLTKPLFGHNYIIEYATKKPEDQAKGCTMTEPSSGRAFINPKTMQIVRIECRTPNHPLPGSTGLWTWSIDYGKVVLNGKTFWLPKKITTEATSYGRRPIEWSFDAIYSNYHELTVTSRILPSIQ